MEQGERVCLASPPSFIWLLYIFQTVDNFLSCSLNIEREKKKGLARFGGSKNKSGSPGAVTPGEHPVSFPPRRYARTHTHTKSNLGDSYCFKFEAGIESLAVGWLERHISNFRLTENFVQLICGCSCRAERLPARQTPSRIPTHGLSLSVLGFFFLSP